MKPLPFVLHYFPQVFEETKNMKESESTGAPMDFCLLKSEHLRPFEGMLLGMPCLKAPRTPTEPSVTALVWKPTMQASSDSSSLPLNKQSQNNHTDARGRWKEHPAHRQLQTSVPDQGKAYRKEHQGLPYSLSSSAHHCSTNHGLNTGEHFLGYLLFPRGLHPPWWIRSLAKTSLLYTLSPWRFFN